MDQISVSDFVPEDRRHGTAPHSPSELGDGTAVFVDVIDFTGLTETHLAAHGRKLGAEKLYRELLALFTRIQSAARTFGGVSVAFAGDGATLYFDAGFFGDKAVAATQAALFATTLRAVSERFRVSLASGPYWRSVIGDPELARFEFVGGEAAERLALLDTARGHPGLLMCETTAARLPRDKVRLEGGPDGHGLTILELVAEPVPLAERGDSLGRDAALEWVPRPIRGVAQAVEISEKDEAAMALGAMAQLRTVTAAFFHMRGLTPESADAIVCAMQRRISALDGTVLALNTDAKGSYLSCVFGAPVGHEDDVERAMIACLQEAASAEAIGLDLGIGVARGAALTGIIATPGRARYDATGQAMSRAARMMVQAPAGMVYVDRPLAEELAASFDFADIPDSTGRRLLRRAERPRTATSGALGVLPVVERDQDLRQIIELCRGGEPAKVVVEAAPGLGKSTLLSSACAALREAGCTVLTGAGEEISRAVSYHAWRDVGRGLTEALGSDGVGTTTRAVLQWLSGAGTALPQSITEVAGPERAARIAEHVATAVGQLAGNRKLVLCFDDQHWMDTASVALLFGIARAGLPVSMLIARRPEPPATMEAAMLLGAPDVTQIALSPLTTDGLLSIAAQQLGASSLSPDLRRLVVEKSGGSPLFAQHIGRTLRDQNLVAYENGHCMVAPGTSGLDRADFLASLETAILARFDRLDDIPRRVAFAASIHGRSFTSEAIEVVLGAEIGPDGVGEGLGVLEREGYIVSASVPERSYAFSHALVQDAINDSLPFTVRRAINARLARWWAQKGGPDAVARRARHTVNAIAEDETDVDKLTRALDVLDAAAEQAAVSNANLEASQFQEQALALVIRLPDDTETRRRRFRLMTSLAYSLALFRGYGDPTVEEAYRNALEFSSEVDAIGDLAFTLYGMFSFYASRGDYSDSARILAQMADLTDGSDDPKMPSFMQHTQAIQTLLTGETARGTELAERSVTGANALGDGMFFDHSGAGDWRIYSGSWAALGQAIQGRWAEAQDTHSSALHLGKTDNFAGAFCNGFAPLPVLANAPRMALQFADRLVADADTRGFALFSIIGRIYQGWAAARLGLKDGRAEAALGGQLPISLAMKLDSFNPYFLCLAAEAHLALGDASAARQAVASANAAVERCGASVFLPEVRRAEAQVLLAEGAAPDDYAARIHDALAIADKTGADHFGYLAAHWATTNGLGAFAEVRDQWAARLRAKAGPPPVIWDGPLAEVWPENAMPAATKPERQNA